MDQFGFGFWRIDQGVFSNRGIGETRADGDNQIAGNNIFQQLGKTAKTQIADITLMGYLPIASSELLKDHTRILNSLGTELLRQLTAKFCGQEKEKK